MPKKKPLSGNAQRRYRPKPKPKPAPPASPPMARKARRGMTMAEEMAHVKSVKERRAKRQARHTNKKRG